MSFRVLSLPVKMSVNVFPPSLADRQGQSSGKYQVTMTGAGTKCTGTKFSHHCLCLMPSSTRETICTVLHLLCNMHTSPNSTYYHYKALLTAYSAWLILPEHKSLSNKHANDTEKKTPQVLLCTTHLHNCSSCYGKTCSLSCFRGSDLFAISCT